MPEVVLKGKLQESLFSVLHSKKKQNKKTRISGKSG